MKKILIKLGPVEAADILGWYCLWENNRNIEKPQPLLKLIREIRRTFTAGRRVVRLSFIRSEASKLYKWHLKWWAHAGKNPRDRKLFKPEAFLYIIDRIRPHC